MRFDAKKLKRFFRSSIKSPYCFFSVFYLGFLTYNKSKIYFNFLSQSDCFIKQSIRDETNLRSWSNIAKVQMSSSTKLLLQAASQILIVYTATFTLCAIVEAGDST